MSMKTSTSLVTNGLVFHYDMNNEKSWKGKPTTNHAYNQNAPAASTYTSYVHTATDLWPTHHPDALTVYNYQGVNISNYVNTGVTNYANSYHAIWTYDRALRKPVVTMRDVDGAWKAKSFGLASGGTPTAMGLGYGDLYTISWLQWTDSTSKSVNAGMYGANTSGVNNFHDGLSQSAYDSTNAYNTKPYTWQRVWATFQVNATRNLSAGWSCYMYGYFNTRNAVKIADVQIETGYVSPLIENGGSTRSNTQALLDLTGRNTITATSLTYTSNGSFSFNGVDNKGTFTSPVTSTSPQTYEIWTNAIASASADSGYGYILFNNNISATTGASYLTIGIRPTQEYFAAFNGAFASMGTGVTANNSNTVQIVLSWDGSVQRVYVNGELKNSQALTTTPQNFSSVTCFGDYTTTYRMIQGNVYAIKAYNRALTQDEIRQNFNALRGRYGI